MCNLESISVSHLCVCFRSIKSALRSTCLTGLRCITIRARLSVSIVGHCFGDWHARASNVKVSDLMTLQYSVKSHVTTQGQTQVRGHQNQERTRSPMSCSRHYLAIDPSLCFTAMQFILHSFMISKALLQLNLSGIYQQNF